MNIKIKKVNEIKIAVVDSNKKLVFDTQSALDFIYESNKGKAIFFSSSEDEAIEKLSCM
ncbi:DUF4180 domain-containing protein [Fusibacter bizertensis]